jgi:hypothetical protein
MSPEDVAALNNLVALQGVWQNYASWIQTAVDIINNGRPSDQTAIATLTQQLSVANASLQTTAPPAIALS